MTLLAALLAQAVSPALVGHRLGRYWLRRPVTLFMLAPTSWVRSPGPAVRGRTALDRHPDAAGHDTPDD
jgi:hypothetical protein